MNILLINDGWINFIEGFWNINKFHYTARVNQVVDSFPASMAWEQINSVTSLSDTTRLYPTWTSFNSWLFIGIDIKKKSE